MEKDNKKIIEINGVKMEVDLRTASTIEAYRVGQNVKLLRKDYNNSYRSYPAVIVGFDEFPNMPTIVIAYLESNYSTAGISFAYLNSATEDFEICPMNTMEMVINKNLVLDNLDRTIEAKEREVVEMKSKREYFLRNFEQYFIGEKKTKKKGSLQVSRG